MWKAIAVSLLLIAGCTQLPQSEKDIEGKRFETVPGKAVIYIVRDAVGAMLSDSLWLDNSAMVTTHTGTYYRWIAEPGARRISGSGVSTVSLTINAEPGKIYFVHHVVNGNERMGVTSNFLERMNDQTGRARVNQASAL